MQTNPIEIHFYSGDSDAEEAARTADSLAAFINNHRRKFGLNAHEVALGLVSLIEHALADMGRSTSPQSSTDTLPVSSISCGAGPLFPALFFNSLIYDLLYPEGWDATHASTVKGIGRAFNVCSNLLINVAPQLWGPEAAKKMSWILHGVADKTLVKMAAQSRPMN